MAIDSSGQWWVGSAPADIQNYLEAYTRSEGAYPATVCRVVRCHCGSDRFRLERADDATRRTCVACGHIHLICRNAEDWEEAEAEEGVEPYSCIACNAKEANLTVGFASYEDPQIDAVKWFYVGVRCAMCGILSCFNDGKVGCGPASEVYESV